MVPRRWGIFLIIEETRLWYESCGIPSQDEWKIRQSGYGEVMTKSFTKNLTAVLAAGVLAVILASGVSAQRGREDNRGNDQKGERPAPSRPAERQRPPDRQPYIRDSRDDQARRDAEARQKAEANRQQQIRNQEQAEQRRRQQEAYDRRAAEERRRNDENRLIRQRQEDETRAIEDKRRQNEIDERRRAAERQKQIDREADDRRNAETRRRQQDRNWQNQPVNVDPNPIRNTRVTREQQELLQKQRVNQYNQRWNNWQALQRERQRYLEQQRRLNYLRYQQRYWQRLRQDQLRLQQARYYDNYYNNYRYFRNGQFYYTSQYGAQMLQRAIQNGYEEGFYAGQADRQDGWGYDPNASYGYVDAALGYDAYFVSYAEYNYYFREGFRRGYEDGYYGRYQYGSYSNGKYSILGTIIGAILDLFID